MRATHGAEMGNLGPLGRQGFIVIRLGRFRVQRQIELVFPAELESRLAAVELELAEVKEKVNTLMKELLG